jgi:hypothetical protein
VLQAGDERQLGRLPQLVARLGPGREIRQPVQQHVRVGLHPDRVGLPGRLGRASHQRHLARPSPAVAQRVQAAVGRDLVQPGAERGAALEADQAAPGREQGLLQHVLSVLHRAENLVAVQQELAPVGVGELAERLLVADPGPGQRA